MSQDLLELRPVVTGHCVSISIGLPILAVFAIATTFPRADRDERCTAAEPAMHV